MHSRFAKAFTRLMLSVCSLVVLSACYDKTRERASSAIHSAAPVPVELTTHLGDQQTFVEGDEIQFLLSLGADAYVYMYHMDAVGHISQLVPNIHQQSNFYNAGYFMTLPEYDYAYRFIVKAPYGEESVWVFASDADIRPREGQTIEQLRDQIKQASSRFGEAMLMLTTVRAE